MGYFSSELEAAEARAGVLGVPVEKLKTQRGVLPKEVAHRVFKAAYQVFKKYVPGDLEKTCQCEITCHAVFEKDWLAVFFS